MLDPWDTNMTAPIHPPLDAAISGGHRARRTSPRRVDSANPSTPVRRWLVSTLSRLAARRQRRTLLDTFENLLTLLESNVTLEAAWKSLVQNQKRTRGRAVIERLSRDAQAGIAMSTTMAALPHHFDVIDVALIRAGESSGALTCGLQRVVDRGHLQGRLTSTFLGAIAYPTFLLLFACVVVIFLTSTVLPNLSAMVVAGGGQIPWATQVLMGIGRALSWGLVPSLLTVVCLATLSGRTSARVRRAINRRLLRVPVLGPAYLNWQLAQFCLVLRTLLDSGVFLPEALILAGDAVADGPVRHAARVLRERVLEGHDIAAAPPEMESDFPAWLWQTLAVGQTSGDLSPVLERVGQRFEQSAVRSAARVAAVIEPAMILAIGLIIGLVAYATLMPVIKLGGLW